MPDLNVGQRDARDISAFLYARAERSEDVVQCRAERNKHRYEYGEDCDRRPARPLDLFELWLHRFPEPARENEVHGASVNQSH